MATGGEVMPILAENKEIPILAGNRDALYTGTAFSKQGLSDGP